MKKIDEITQMSKEILPDDMIDLLFSEVDDKPDIEKGEYLDTLKVSMVSLIDSTNKYFSTEELKDEILRFQTEVNKMKSKSGMGLFCNSDLRFGYANANANEISGNVNTSLLAGLSMTEGGGVETVYDFVHMDRGIYHHSFCGLGVSLGPQFGAGISSGYSGISKFITNIGLNQQDNISRFSGPSVSSSVGISVGFKLKIGISAGVSIGTSRGVYDAFDISNSYILSGSTCPAAFESVIDPRSFISYSLSTGAGAGTGVGTIIGAIEDEQVASISYSIDQLHTNYGKDRWGRKISSTSNGSRNFGHSVEGLYSGAAGLDLTASAMALAYGFFAPSDCEDPAYLPAVSSVEISNIQSNSLIASAEILDDGDGSISEKGFCWSEEQNPTSENDCNSEGTGSDDFTCTISNLQPNTEYYVRAYATNEMGTAYGEQNNFTTDAEAGMPSVNTATITSITENSAQSGGNVTDDSGASVTARGVCWSTTQNLSTNDSCSSAGSGTGNFTSNLTNLSSETQYFVRAYATNSVGTSYGNQESFTTDAEDDGNDERQSWNSNDAAGAIASTLKLPKPGFRGHSFGKLANEGHLGGFWSNSVSDFSSVVLDIYNAGAGFHNANRADGWTVRCIKNNL